MPDHTEAAVLYQLKQPLKITSLQIPALKPGQVRVNVAYSGICHTQIHEIEGNRGPDHFLPHTLGHEGAGIVSEVGEGVTKVKRGDRVVLSWIKGLGADVPGTVYQSGNEKVNSGAISTFMRETVTCENRLTPIPENMPLKQAALLGCAVPTGAGIVLNTAKVKPGETVVIFGAGGIGLSAILGARIAKASLIIAVDVYDAKLETARLLGATHTVNAKTTDPVKAIREWTNGRGADYAIEAAGRIETMEKAFESVRTGGGLCVLAGNLPFGEKISIDPFELIKGKRIIGTWGGETQPDRDIPIYIKEYLAGNLNLDGLITHEFTLEKINSAFDDIKQGRVSRAIVKL